MLTPLAKYVLIVCTILSGTWLYGMEEENENQKMQVPSILPGNPKRVKINHSAAQADAQLLNGADTSNLAEVQTALRHSASVSARDDFGLTALYLAAQHGAREIVELLLTYGADVNDQTDTGATALHAAALYGNVAVAHLLLIRGTQPDVRNNQGQTPLHYAAQYGHADLVVLLLNHSADCEAIGFKNNRPLHCAAFWGHHKIIELLLKHGCSINAMGEGNETALYQALFMCKERAAQGLIQAGAQLPNENGRLRLALRSPGIRKLLLRYGIINAQIMGRDLLYPFNRGTINDAAAIGAVELLEGLLAQNHTPKDLQQALLYAVGQNHLKAVALLLGRLGNACNLTAALAITAIPENRLTHTVIHQQLIRRLPLFDQITLRQDLHTIVLSNAQLFPIEMRRRALTISELLLYAVQTLDYDETVQALHAGADPDTHNADGLSCLWLAATHENREAARDVVTLLILQGATPTTNNPAGMDLTVWLIEHNRVQMARLLVSYGARANPQVVNAITNNDLIRSVCNGNMGQISASLATPRSPYEIASGLLYAVTHTSQRCISMFLNHIHDSHLLETPYALITIALRRRSQAVTERRRLAKIRAALNLFRATIQRHSSSV